MEGHLGSGGGVSLTGRSIAGIIDLAIIAGLCLFPRVGWVLGLVYLLARDALPFLGGQSFGKNLMGLKVVTIKGGMPLTAYPEKSVIRGLVSLIPLLNLVDIWLLYSSGSRLADKWANTRVVQAGSDETLGIST